MYLSLCFIRVFRAFENGRSSSYYFLLMNDTYDFKHTSCVALHVRIANWVGENSRCRGGIVDTRVGCSSALLVRYKSSKALWRFRVSTSNSLNGRNLPHTYTPIRYIYQTYAQQDIRVCGDDHF